MVWDPPSDAFQRGLEALRNYAKVNGHAQVPRSYVDASGFNLSVWVMSRRSDYKNGRLEPEDIADLNALEMIWDPVEDYFRQGVDALKSYVTNTNHARVPLDHRESDGFRLGRWIINRRSEWLAGRLAPDRIAILEALGMVWDLKADFFDRNLNALRTYVAREGHARVPTAHREGEFRLGQWIGVQRVARGKGALAPERVAALEALGMVWQVYKKRKQD
jgi:hypothetical protein